MARTKFVVEDSFEAIFRDLERIGKDTGEEMRREMGETVAEIIDNTPQDTGMTASGWKKAADALGAKHNPIKQGESFRTIMKGGKKIRFRERSPALGKKKGSYSEKFTGKSGRKLTRVTMEAANGVKEASFNEYGVSAHAAAGGRGSFSGKNYVEINGYQYGMRPLHIVRNAIRNFKNRLGPVFSKIFKIGIRRPKRYKRKVYK